MAGRMSVKVPENTGGHSRLHYVLLTILAVWSSFPFRRLLFEIDEGLYYDEALRMLRGEVIYRDFFEFVTPGTFFFIKWTFQILGENVMAVRYVLFGLYVLEIWLVFWLGMRILRRASLAYLPTLFFIQEKYQSWWSIQHQVLSHFTTMLAAYLLVRFSDDGKPRFVIWSGIAVGLTFCISQHLGFLLFIASLPLVIWWIPRNVNRPRGRSTLLFLAGAGVPVLALLTYLAVNGALWDAYECCIQWVFSSYRTYEGQVPYFDEGRKLIARWWQSLPAHAAIRWIIHIVLVGYGSLLGITAGFVHLLINGWRKPAEDAPRKALAVYGIVWCVGTALLAQEVAHPNYYWGIAQRGTLCLVFAVSLLSYWCDLFLPQIRYWQDKTPLDNGLYARHFHVGLAAATPVLSVIPRIRLETQEQGAAGEQFLVRVGLSLPSPRSSWSGIQLLLTLAIMALLYWEVGGELLMVPRGARLQRSQRAYIQTSFGQFWSVNRELVSDLAEVRRHVHSHTQPEEPILVVYHTPYLYFLTQRANASRYSILWPGYHTDTQVAEIVHDLARQKAALVIKDQLVEINLERGDMRLLQYGAENLAREPILRAVQRNYRPVLQLKNFTIYARAPRLHP